MIYAGQSGAWIYLILIVVVLMRLLRMRGARQLNPLLLVVVALLVLFGSIQLVYFESINSTVLQGKAAGSPLPTSVDPATIPYYVLGALLGLALGVVRGRTISVYRDAVSGQVVQQGGAMALLIWVALFSLRAGAQYLVRANVIGSWATPITDVLLLLGTFSIIGANVYLLVRYFQLRSAAT